MPRLKLWYVADAYTGPNAGTESQLLLLIREMTMQGHDVRLFVFRHTEYTSAVNDFPCPIECLDIRSVASLDSVRKIRAFRARVRLERPDVVHVSFNDAAILVPPFAKVAGTRVFTSRRDMGFWHTPAQLLALRIANRFVDRIFCNSHAVAAVVAAKEGAQASKLLVIHNGIKLDLPGSGPRPGEPWVESFEANRGTINVCLVANLRPIKRIEDLVKAAARIFSEIKGLRIWVAGSALETGYAKKIESLVHEVGMSAQITFLGGVDDAAWLMRHCDIGVLTSQSEGLSNTLLEYFSNGLPVVCSDAAANAELVRNESEGFLYPVGDYKALGRRLLALCSDEQLRARMSAAALKRAQDFSIGKYTQAYFNAYTASPSSPPSRVTRSL